MTLSEELQWRGFINQTTLKNMQELDTKSWVAYHGFDASARSQTIGNLAAMMFDMVFLRHGHKLILLAGGATSLVGDPGGKDSERTLQSEEIIRSHVAAAETQLRHIYRGHSFTLVNNLDWFKNMNVLHFLRDVGKHFGMSTLVQRDYIQKRIGPGGTGMSYTEFSYTLLQGYDFLHLFDEFGCNLQLAGADQWGNGLSGVDLIRKTRGAEAHVMTLPLMINKTTGKKFGKSEAGAVWLDESLTSVYQFYQFWLNTEDDAVVDYLKVFTPLEKSVIDELEAATKEAPFKREAQKRLTFEVTQLVHGRKRAESVVKVSEVLFGARAVNELSAVELDELAKEVPVSTGGKQASIILVEQGLVSSTSEALRLIKSGGVSLNGQKLVTDQEVTDSPALLKKGKNSVCLVR